MYNVTHCHVLLKSLLLIVGYMFTSAVISIVLIFGQSPYPNARCYKTLKIQSQLEIIWN